MKSIIVVFFFSDGRNEAYSTLSRFCEMYKKYNAQTIRNYMSRNRTLIYEDTEIKLSKLNIIR